MMVEIAMKLLRSAFSVFAGYLLFAVSAFSLFQLSGRPPHREAPWAFMAASCAFGSLFAALGGYAAGWLAGRSPLRHGVAVGAVLAAGAGFSLASMIGKGAIWSQASALIFMAPSAVVGGWLRSRQIACG